VIRKVEVVPHRPDWHSAFESESMQVMVALGDDNVVAVHHIGSTAIPRIYAKPIIDMLVEVREISKIDERSPAIAGLGYTVMGEFGIPDRRFFLKNDDSGVRTHHVHAFEVGSAQIERHLTFRDYMRAHGEDAQKYSDLKQQLVKQYPNDIEGYMDGKDEFIKEIDRKAAEWRSSQASRYMTET
jgi:GrpB-like predicted nucleotidyltransferase (UPF0157 family)